MTPEEITKKLTEHEEKIKTLFVNMNELKKFTSALNKLTTSVEILATQYGDMRETVVSIDHKVSDMERVPGDNWKRLTGYILAAICSAGVGALITYLIK